MFRWGWRWEWRGGVGGIEVFKFDDEMFCNFFFYNRVSLKRLLNNRKE